MPEDAHDGTPNLPIPPDANPDIKIVGRPFLIVVYIVAGFGVLTLLSAIFMTVFADTTDGAVTSSIDKLWTAFFSIMSALVGLLGGKAIP